MTEKEGFMIEAALAAGFTMTNDDGTEFSCTEANVIELLTKCRKATPSSNWFVNGEPDPHGDRYNCERVDLTLGNMTDDELANAAFMNYDVWPNPQDIIAGKALMPIVYMKAVKERIRWLSRQLERKNAPPTGHGLSDFGETADKG
jgi:hypothetical protein